MLINSQEVKNLPNIKSAIKRVKITKSKTLNNLIRKSALKTKIKKEKANGVVKLEYVVLKRKILIFVTNVKNFLVKSIPKN